MYPVETGASSVRKTGLGALKLAKFVWQKKSWVFLPSLIMCIMTLGYTLFLPSVYVSQAFIQVEDKQSQLDDGVETLKSRLLSPDVANKVISNLGLQRRAEFDPLMHGIGIVKSFMVGAGFASDPRLFSKQQRVLTAFFEKLSAGQGVDSSLVAVTFKSRDRELAAIIANRVAEEGIASTAPGSLKVETQNSALMEKINQLETQVATLKKAKDDFSASLTPSDKNGGESVGVNMQAKSHAADLLSRATFIREAIRLGRILEAQDVLSQDGVRRLLEQRGQIKNQISADERSLPPTHPKMKESYTQLNALDLQLRTIADKVARGFENEAQAIAARNGIPFPSKPSEGRNDITALNTQIAALEQEAAFLKGKLQDSSQLSSQADQSQTKSSSSSYKIVERAVSAKSPSYYSSIMMVTYNTIFVFIFSLLFVTLYFFVFSFKDKELANVSAFIQSSSPDYKTATNPEAAHDSVKTFDWAQNAHTDAKVADSAAISPSAINQNTPGSVLPGLGTPKGLPVQQEKQPSPLEPSSKNALDKNLNAAEEISQELQYLGYLGRGKVTVIFGHEVNARTSLHAIRFGRRLALEGSVITIELFRKDDLYAKIAGQNLAGLGDYLEGKANLAEIIHRDARSKLHIIPSNDITAFHIFDQHSKEMLEEMIKLLCQSYAHVVIDAGTIGSAGEIMASLADALVVITQSETTNPALLRNTDRLETISGGRVFIVMDEARDAMTEQRDHAPRIVGVVRR